MRILSTLLVCISFSTAANAGLVKLSDIAPDQLPAIKQQIMSAALQIHSAMDKTPGHHMEAVSTELMEEVLAIDAQYPLSYLWLEGNTVAGFILLSPYLKQNEHAARVIKLGVIEKYRGSGISRQLLNAFATDAKKLGFPTIKLLVGKHNQHAICNVYLRYDFEVEKQGSVWTHMAIPTDRLIETTK